MYDYIIIGAGTAGGIISHNLVKAGASCLLIEAGKHFTKDTFPATEADASAQLYWGGGMEFSSDAQMAFLRGRTVGGGSVVNQALMDRFDDVALNDWQDESGIDFFTPEAMDPYYEKAENGIALYTFEAQDRNRNAQLFVEGCEKLGYEWHFLRRAQRDCQLAKDNDCISCLAGCHRDSKQSTLVTYIRDALPLGLELQPETTVEGFESTNDKVRVHVLSKGEKQTVEGRNLVISGGAFGTTSLLLKAGFKKSHPALGKYFATHPQFMFFGLYDEMINAHKGMFQSVASKDPRFRKRGFKLENVFAGPPSIAMLYTGFGADHLDFMQHYSKMTCAEVAIRDENAGEISVTKKGKLIVNKQLTDQDRARMKDGTTVLQEILKASGAKRVVESPLFFGLHLMGGCRIGLDPGKSVVEPDFTLRDHRNIFVCDSSLYPNAPGINPALTIMALSHMFSEQLTK